MGRETATFLTFNLIIKKKYNKIKEPVWVQWNILPTIKQKIG